MKIPNFKNNVLPPNDYAVTFDELRSSVLVNGCGDLRERTWDKQWRNTLVNNLEVMAKQLWKVGIENIYVNGSFVENKDHPNDIDGYFDCDLHFLASGELERELNLLDKDKIWTWDRYTRRPYLGYEKKQLPMWHKYRVEMYPHATGLSSGIKDKYGNELEFPAAFRISRENNEPKGIIKLKR